MAAGVGLALAVMGLLPIVLSICFRGSADCLPSRAGASVFIAAHVRNINQFQTVYSVPDRTDLYFLSGVLPLTDRPILGRAGALLPSITGSAPANGRMGPRIAWKPFFT